MRTVTIIFSKAGVMQYYRCMVNETLTEILNIDFNCKWVNKDSENYPVFELNESLSSVLDKIAKFSYDGKAEIWAIDDIYFNCNDKKDIHNIYVSKINSIFNEFLEKEILPELPKGYVFKWNSIAYGEKYLREIQKYEKIYNRINYLCYRFLYDLEMVKHNSFDSETRYIKDYLDIVVSRAK